MGEKNREVQSTVTARSFRKPARQLNSRNLPALLSVGKYSESRRRMQCRCVSLDSSFRSYARLGGSSFFDPSGCRSKEAGPRTSTASAILNQSFCRCQAAQIHRFQSCVRRNNPLAWRGFATFYSQNIRLRFGPVKTAALMAGIFAFLDPSLHPWKGTTQ